MGILNKVKDFFYEDVDDFDEEEVKSKKEDKKEDKINIYDIVREKNKDKVKEDKEEVKVKTRAKKSEPVVETENLFRAERKFNFPIDVDDEEDNFENTSQDIPYVQEKVTSHESQPTAPRRNEQVQRSYSQTYSKTYSQSYSPYKKETKKFKPTPVISPIYGVLNENYKKEDIVDTAKTRTMMQEKATDFDLVRKKAYADLDDALEKTMKETPKNIFYNIDESDKDKEIDDDLKNDYEEEPYKKDEVIITYGEVEESEEAEEIVPVEPANEDDDLEVPKISRNKKNKIENSVDTDEDNDDLFKIIDNMYNDDSEEDEE